MNPVARPTGQLAAFGRSAGRTTARALGFVFFAIGLAGVVLPLLPTTIFWILAAALFAHSSPTMRARIFAWPRIGPVVRDYLEDGAVGRPAKLAAALGIAFGVGVVWLVLWREPALAGLVTAAMALVALYVGTRPSPRDQSAADH